MNWEWWLAALPVVFLLGWFAARLDIRHIRKTAGELPRAYLRGLSHLLRGEKNAALDCFLRAEPLDPESEELQFAIGELSRTRGEHRRALKVHHRLCESETVGGENRLRARWELAQDYFRMGFFDIAEKHAAALAEEEEYRERAAGMLLDIFQRARDFGKALEALDKMPPEAALVRRKTRAHLLCECARSGGGDLPLREALAADGGCVRANLMLGEAAAQKKDYETAARHYEAAERQNPEYLRLVAAPFFAACEARNLADEGEKKLRMWLAAHSSPALFESVYRVLESRGRAGGMAEECVRDGLGAAAAAAWAGEQLRGADAAAVGFWRALESSLAAAGWRCETCGCKTSDFAWQCHNCLSWESFRHAPFTDA